VTSRRHLSALVALLVTAACSGTASIPATTTAPGGTTFPITGATTTLPPTTSTTIAGAIGEGSLGDPYFPALGNSGYDVRHYDITLTVDPETGEITAGQTVITAVADEDLARFELDLAGLDVSSISVDGVPATWERVDEKLVIDPNATLAGGEEFITDVAYSGRPRTIVVPGAGVAGGWIVNSEGLYVAAEPDGAHTWFPSNDHPSDKATFTITTTVPQGWTVASNGELVAETSTDDATTFSWAMDYPMATYLATIAIGEFRRVETPSDNGIVLRDYLPADLVGLPAPMASAGAMIDFLSSWFGPYPFDRYGHVVVPDFPGAMEDQTMTIIGRGAIFDNVVVHEVAHQWFGDDVSPATWQDVWLNEGFATFAEFLWIEHQLGTEAMLTEVQRDHDRLTSARHAAIADPGVDELFGLGVYLRGGLTLHALRLEVGDDVMRQILTTYASRFSGGNASTDDFVGVVGEVTGRDFTDFFDTWLHQAELPPLP